MTNLLDLPSECLLQILRYLKPHHMQGLAQTFNKQILSLCLPLLAPIIVKARNKRRMRMIFGALCPTMIDMDDINNTDFGYEEYCPPEDPLNHLQFLEPIGDFHWLLPIERTTSGVSFASKNNIASADLEKLRSTLKQLNVEKAVPDVFWKFGVDDNLHHDIPTMTGGYFQLGDVATISPEVLHRLAIERKATMPSGVIGKQEIDTAAAGNDVVIAERNYVFKFYCDHEDLPCWNLFLDTAGGHCILQSCQWDNERCCHMSSQESPDADGTEEHENKSMLSDIEKELGVKSLTFNQATDFVLEATDLEKWLVNQSYTERASSYFLDEYFGEMEPDQAKKYSDDMKRFLWNVYTKEGRQEQLL